MTCKEGFCWCFLSLVQTVQKENFKLPSSYYSNTLDQINENAIAGGGWLNYPVVNISVIAASQQRRN